MARVKVHVWGGLFARAKIAGGHGTIELDVPGDEATPRQILSRLTEEYGGLLKRAVTDPQSGGPGGGITVLVDGRPVNSPPAFDRPVLPGSHVAIIHMAALHS